MFLRPGKSGAPELWVRQGNSSRQLALDAAIKTALNKREPALKAVGSCYNCGEVFGDDEQSLRFCDEDCRDDYEHRMTRRRLNGTLQ